MKYTRLICAAGSLLYAVSASSDGWDPDSRASAIGSIENTRHNLSMSYSETARTTMGAIARNDYGEVCIYCHTPHGANSQINAPLWNRTINNSGAYTIYDKPTTLMRPIGQPGPNSLTCLSCHDGTIAIDSILNMPGSGREPTNSGLTNNETNTWNEAFLDSWASNTAGLASPAGHFRMGRDVSDGFCTLCHNSDPADSPMSNFNIFTLETDLRDDHPIGVQYPVAFGPSIDFNEPNGGAGTNMPFFDQDGDNHADPNEVRLYNTGQGPEVECASCHDPHGVPSDGANARFSPSFLRVNNGIAGNNAGTAGIVSNGPSALCLTCHTK